MEEDIRISRLERDGTEKSRVFGPHMQQQIPNVEVSSPDRGRDTPRCLRPDGMTITLHVRR